MNAERQYRLKGLTERELVAELDRIWPEAQRDETLCTIAAQQGLDLRTVKRSEVIQVSIADSGIDPEMVKLMVAFVPLFAKIAGDLWDAYILPRLRKTHGEEALQEKEPDKV